MQKVLITGGAGFIGSKLSLKLLLNGYDVSVLDILHEQIHGKNPVSDSPSFAVIKDKVNIIRASVTDRVVMEQALADADIVVHLAAETGTGQSMYEIERYNHVNICGTATLLDFVANKPNRVKKIVVASSRAIYGEGKYQSHEMGFVYPGHRADHDLAKGDFEVKYPGCQHPLLAIPTDEESKLHPGSIYGITKQAQEQLVMNATKSLGIAGVSLRYQNVYGPGQSLANPYTGILSIFSTRIKNNKPINVFEDGHESRDFVFIDDVVDATFLAIENPMADGQVFNVGSGVPTNVLTVVEQLMKLYNADVPVYISGNYRIGDIRHNFADISKIKNILGFEPKYSFENGIGLFTSWVVQQQHFLDKYEQSLEEMKSKGLFK
jgi:dTDP-L-rhamnose 4-epimerase